MITVTPGESYEILVKSSEYYQLKKKLAKGIHQTIVRTIHDKPCTCKVDDTVNNMKVAVTVLKVL